MTTKVDRGVNSHEPLVLIITGLSGAGKHQVLYQLEDLGFFCIDNLPAFLIEPTLGALQGTTMIYPRLAIGVDVRTRTFHPALQKALRTFKQEEQKHKIIFLEAKAEELVRRFAETRRPHPLDEKKPLSARIHQEIKMLGWLRAQADLIVDSTHLTPPELRRQLLQWLGQEKAGLQVMLSSFGFKYGLPQEADMIFDVRFLPNPFYKPALKKLNGLDAKVRRFVLGSPLAQTSLDHMVSLINSIQDGFVREGKLQLHLAIGCTGGQHRSVVMTEALGKKMANVTMIYHRELQAPSGMGAGMKR